MWPVAGVLLGAPVSAELLQAYLPLTGDALETLFFVAFLAPLYGGAALLIREVAVRTGRGWPGTLLIAAGFGVAMPGLIDLSAFTEDADYATGWTELWAPTEAFGLSWHGMVMWSLGHVVMSIGVPLAILDGLAPSTRGRPLLGRVGLVVVGTLFVGVAALVRSDAARSADPTLLQTAGVTAVVAGLVLTGLSRWGRPVPRTADRRAWRSGTASIFGIAVVAVLDLSAPTWTGLVVGAGLALLAAGVLLRAAASRSWGLRQIVAVASGALIGRTLVGFVAPLPPDVPLPAKLIQSTVMLLAVLGVVVLAHRRARRVADDRPCASTAEKARDGRRAVGHLSLRRRSS